MMVSSASLASISVFLESRIESFLNFGMASPCFGMLLLPFLKTAEIVSRLRNHRVLATLPKFVDVLVRRLGS